MKKIVSIFAAALLAAGFMGCSNDSDDNSALLLALSSKNSSSASLPASVGENELADKKFQGSWHSCFPVEFDFSDSTYKQIFMDEVAESSEGSAYTEVFECTYSYLYNSKTKRIYSKLIDSSSYIVRGDEKILVPFSFLNGRFTLSSVSSDAQLVNLFKEMYKARYDKADDYFINSQASALLDSVRSNYFGFYGYTYTTGLTSEIIARFNRAKELYKNTVSCEAYSLSSTGLKLVNDDTYYPKGTKLSDFLSLFADRSLNVVNNDSTKYTFDYELQYTWPERYCALTYSNNLLGCFVSSVSETAINASKLGHRTSSDSDYEFNNTGTSLKLEKTETESQAVYKVYGISPDSEDGSESLFGTITIPYATSSNIPDFTGEDEYALVQ